MTASNSKITAEQRAYARDLWDDHQAQKPSPPTPAERGRSRTLTIHGPTAPGDFSRVFPDPFFPYLYLDNETGAVGLRHTVDYDAACTWRGWGYSRPGGVVFARDAHIGVATGRLPDGSPFPPFAFAQWITPGNGAKDIPVFRIVNALTGEGRTVTSVYMDRIYTKRQASELLHPLLHRGIHVGMDLTKAQRNATTTLAAGVTIRDGWPYAPMPEEHWTIERPPLDATSAELAAFHARIGERRPYAFTENGRRNGSIQFRGPANPKAYDYDTTGRVIGVRGVTARCINARWYHIMDKTLPKTTCKKGDTCRCGRTVSVRIDDLPSGWVDRGWGHDEWAIDYARRVAAETHNAWEEYHAGIDEHSIRTLPELWPLMRMFQIVGLTLHHWWRWMIKLGIDPRYDDPLHPDNRREMLAKVMTPADSEEEEGEGEDEAA